MQLSSSIVRRSVQAALITLILVVQTGFSFGQSWQPIGPDQRDALGLDKQTVFRLFDRNDTVYASVRGDHNQLLMIKKFDGTAWNIVGSPFSTGLNASYTGPGYAIITLDKGYNQYVAYPDPGQQVLGGFKPTVKKLVNGQWQTIGQPGIGIHAAYISGLEVDSFGKPYLVFNTVYDQKPHIVTFDGSAWVSIDPPVFSASNVSTPALALDSQGTPYISFVSGGNVSVLTYINNTWAPVGGNSTVASGATGLLMTLKKDGFPILTLNTTPITVLDFDGTSWSSLPSPGSMQGYGAFMAIDTVNMPYLLYGGNVRKFDGTSWSVLGTSPGQPSSSGTLAIVGGQPVMANQDKVKRFDGTNWPMLGEYGYSPGQIQTSKIAISSSGVLFSAFKDHEHDGKLTVMKQVNGLWSIVGAPGFTAEIVDIVDIAAGKNDTMFVLYTTVGVVKKPVVIRYDGVSWVELGSGTNTVSSAELTDVSLATDTNGIPLVAFVDPAYFDACHVRKFENGFWTSVGGGVMNTPPATLLTLRVAPDNTIYLLTHLYLAKFVGGTWQTVGNYGSSANKPDLRIDKSGTPYIAYTRFEHTGNAIYILNDYVAKFDGVAWILLGGGAHGINGGFFWDVNRTSLAIDTADRLYLASSIQNSPFPAQVIIKTFDGTNWGSINAPWNGWSGFYFPQNDFQLEAANDYLFFAYDDGNAYLLGIPLPLLFLNVPEVVTPAANLSLYPNPTSHSLTVSASDLDASQVTIEVVDVLGRIVKRETGRCANGVLEKTINTETLPSGSYLLVINGKQERRVAKFIKE